MDLIQELWRINELLTKALEQYKTRGIEYAKAQAKYRKLLAQTILKLKADGMQTTLIGDVARGQDDVVEAKEQEIIAETMCDSCKESINGFKLQMRILQDQINKEWGRTD